MTPRGDGPSPTPAQGAAAAALVDLEQRIISSSAPCEDEGEVASSSSAWDEGVTLERLRRDLSRFAEERNWNQFHQPRNLLLALVGEVGEVSELFQWRGEVRRGIPEFSAEERQAVSEELSDVLLYLVRLADACNIDLGKAALSKMVKNASKYPVDKCRGSSKKYTELGNGSDS